MATIFVSPGVYTAEQDFTVFASRIGITRLGLVGKTVKGPAFEPIKISSTDEFLIRFGGTDSSLPLPYVANSFLGQSNELTVTRILGGNGFVNSPAWMIVADVSLYSGTTTQTGMTFTVTDQPYIQTWTVTTTENSLMADGTISASTIGNNAFVDFSGNTVTTSDWLAALGLTNFSGYGITVTGDGPTTIETGGVTVITISANVAETPKGSKAGAVLAVLRSKKNNASDLFYFQNESDITIGNVTTTLGDFTLSASTGPLTAMTAGYTVSLDETRQDYITKILGKSPKIISGLPNFYVERIYPHFIREAINRAEITGLKTKLVYSTEDAYENFQAGYTNPQTPWVVSRVIGGAVRRLFKFQSVSDGDSANSEIKISVANIDIVNHTFDVVIRNFNDTDATASSSAYERWSSLSMDPSNVNYIGKVIGTTDETYPRKSSFITVDIAENVPTTSVPAGFEGYTLRTTGISGTTSPELYYKTDYFSGDSKFKTYLGISELAYTSLTQSLTVTAYNSVKTLETDLFAFDGINQSATTVSTTKGFHMENTADSSLFITGNKKSLTGYTNAAGNLVDKTQLKFTLVPYGGFDGWDKYQAYENLYEEFDDAYQSNVDAFKAGIDTMSSPEQIDINLFATPGIDFMHNTSIVQYALDMIELRADSLYVIDSPRLGDGVNKGTPEELVSNLDSIVLNSNYAATYWPWIQILDSTSNLYTYQSPTLMAVRAMAYTDNITAPWFAPAGLTRGLAGANIIRADVKLTKYQRDTLYQGRVNPIASFVQQGVTIWGQKTLQIQQSALDRINVRRLLLQVRRLVAAASLTLVFEQNDQTLRDQFLAKVEPILLQIQNQRGLTAFKVVMDNSNNTNDTIDRNTLVGKIQLQPTRTAEFIDLTFQVLPTGASFENF